MNNPQKIARKTEQNRACLSNFDEIRERDEISKTVSFFPLFPGGTLATQVARVNFKMT
jgi:hypothetical protein